MELWRLRYFVVVAEEEHVGRAAERLHVSQSPLSRQIRHLEEELGFDLFHREGRGVRLTSAGQTAYLLARDLLAEAERAKFHLKALGRGEAGPIRVGYVQGATYNGALPQTLARLKKLAPGVKPQLIPMSSQEQISAVLDGEIEIGFVHHQIDNKKIACRRVYSEEFVLAICENDAEEMTEVTNETLQALHWIMLPYTATSGIRSSLELALKQLGFTPQIVLETVDISAALSFIASGLGVSLIQESIARNLPAGIVTSAIPDLDVRIDTVVIWNATRIAPTTLRFLQALPSEI